MMDNPKDRDDVLEALKAITLPNREWIEADDSERVVMVEITTTALRVALKAIDKAECEVHQPLSRTLGQHN